MDSSNPAWVSLAVMSYLALVDLLCSFDYCSILENVDALILYLAFSSLLVTITSSFCFPSLPPRDFFLLVLGFIPLLGSLYFC